MGPVLGNLIPEIDARLQRLTTKREIFCDFRGADGEKIRGNLGRKAYMERV